MSFKKITLLIILISIILFIIIPSSSIIAVTQSVKLDDPLKLPADQPIPTLIGKIIQALLGIVGSLALVMFIYGGVVWMTSTGNDQKVQKGKDILIWAAIGLIVIFTSYVLVNFIITGIGAGESESSGAGSWNEVAN